LFHVFVTTKNGQASLRWVMPTCFRNATIYFQVAAFNPKNIKFPVETSNMLTRLVLL